MPTWPVSLPELPLTGGFDETPPDTTLETQMDAGPPKARRRFSAGVRKIGVKMIMTTAEVATMDAFYVATLQGGALTFDYDHPRTGVSQTYRINGLSYQHLTPGEYRVGFQLMQQP